MKKKVHLFGKRKKHRFSYLNAKAEVALKEYLQTRNDNSEYLFVTERKPIKNLNKEAIEKIVRNISKRTFGDQKKSNSAYIPPHHNYYSHEKRYAYTVYTAYVGP